MALSSELFTQALLSALTTKIKTALKGLETLSDADAAAYLSKNPGAVEQCPWMPSQFTAAMITEVRKSK